MIEAKLLRKKLKNGLIVEKWDLVTIIENQQKEIEQLKYNLQHYEDRWRNTLIDLQVEKDWKCDK